MSRIQRGPDEQRRVLLRKAKVFASRGEDHLAELHINHALELQTPLDEVNAALDDLDPRQATFTRRDALRRASMLLGAGMLVGPGFFRDLVRTAGVSTGGVAREQLVRERLAAATTVGGSVEGLFLKVPSIGLGDGSYTVVPVAANGLLPGHGPYFGDTVARGDVAYNVSQSWSTGSVVTNVTVLGNSGPTAHYAFPGGGTTQGASTTESDTTVTKVGACLYCSHTWLRIFIGPGELTGDKAGFPLVRLVSQPTLEVIDIETGKLVGNWLGPELEGACRASLKVSSDGTGVLLATDIPGAAPDAPSLHWFRFHDGVLSALASTSPVPETMTGILGRDYHWPTVDSPLLGVSPMGVHVFAPASQRQSLNELPVQWGNNRLPPLWQGAFSAAGNPAVSTGDGRVFHGGGGFFQRSAAAMAVPPMQASTLSENAVTPPFLVYQGAQLQNVFATAGNDTWMVDNREGVGGVWRLDPAMRPLEHQLPGSYISSVTTDGSGAYLAALSSLESVLYLLGPDSTVGAFRTLPYAELIQGSTT